LSSVSGYRWNSPQSHAEFQALPFGSVYEMHHKHLAIGETLITTQKIFRENNGYHVHSFRHWVPKDVFFALKINDTNQTEEVVSFFSIPRAYLYVRTATSNEWRRAKKSEKDYVKFLPKLNASDTENLLQENFSLNLDRLWTTSSIFELCDEVSHSVPFFNKT
jgi:hypothetical protein